MRALVAATVLAACAVCAICTEVPAFPLIDIDPIIRPDNYHFREIAVVLDQIKNASTEWGFFNVVNHGVSQDLQDRMFQQLQLFFASPREVKDPVRRSESNSRGYADLEYTKQRIDRKEVFDVGPFQMDEARLSAQGKKDYALDGVNLWPDEAALPQFKATVAEYYEAIHGLAWTVLRSAAFPMRCIPRGFFEDKFDQHSSLLRLNHYPVSMEGSTQAEEGAAIDYEQLGVGHHTDAGGLTVLLQDLRGGLQVYKGTKQANGDGEWIPVPAAAGAITINIGDMLQIWTNNVYKAAEHRVVASSRASRYSVPFFFNPNYDTVVSPLRCQPDEAEQAKPRFASVRWGDFRSERYLGDFADFGEEIQIDEFKAEL